MDDAVDLSIIVVAWNVKELCDECFRALRASTDRLRKEILFVDNGSVDGTADFVEATFPEVTVIRSPTNLGFIRANNLAFRQATGRHILMLNSDAFVTPEVLQASVDYLDAHADVGVVGARLVGRDGVLQPSARFFPTPFKLFLQKTGLRKLFPWVGPLDDLSWDHLSPRDCDWVVGCYLMVRKDLVDREGFFLREDFFMYNDDNDLCLRIRKQGFRTVFLPWEVIHLGGATVKKMGRVDEKSAQIEKWHLESLTIYFRKNYHWGTAVNNFLLLELYDLLMMVKKLFFPNRDTTFSELWAHMGLIADIHFKTGFGTRPIH